MQRRKFMREVSRSFRSVKEPIWCIAKEDREFCKSVLQCRFPPDLVSYYCETVDRLPFVDLDHPDYVKELSKKKGSVLWRVWQSIGAKLFYHMAREEWRVNGPLKFDRLHYTCLAINFAELLYAAPWKECAYDEPSECAICLEKIFNPLTTDCGHRFHEDCLLRWNRKECPLCRQETGMF